MASPASSRGGRPDGCPGRRDPAGKARRIGRRSARRHGREARETRTTFALIAAAASLPAACAEEAAPPAPAAATANAAEQACLRDVAATTDDGEVRVVASTFSRAGTEVILGVGPTGQWRCIAYADGTTAGIQSLTDEGRL